MLPVRHVGSAGPSARAGARRTARTEAAPRPWARCYEEACPRRARGTLAPKGMSGRSRYKGWPVRAEPKHVARYAWPAGLTAAGAAWYAADSLRHRRESGHGYTPRGDVDVPEANFLRACEALTGAPISYGND